MRIIEDLTPVNHEKTRYNTPIDTIVFHSMGGFYNGTISWFKNPDAQVSAHYLISKTGEIRRMVKEEHRAWHAGTWNNRSIGIELEDEKKGASWKYTEKQKEALRFLVQDIESRYGKLNYVLHKDISSNRSDPVGNFTLDWLTSSPQNPPMSDQDKKDIESMRLLREYKDVWYEAKHVIESYESLEKERNFLGSEISKKSDRIKALEKTEQEHITVIQDLRTENSSLTIELLDTKTLLSEALEKLEKPTPYKRLYEEAVAELKRYETLLDKEWVKGAKNSFVKALQVALYDIDLYITNITKKSRGVD